MKLWYAVFAGLLGIAATSGVAQAQWSSDAPTWRDDGRYDRGYGDPYDGRAGPSSASLERAAHTLADESASFADALHAFAPRSRIARDAMGVALVAERFHRSIEHGAPPPVIVRQLRALNREMSQLLAMAEFHRDRGREQLARMVAAFEITRDLAREELGGGGRPYANDPYYGQAPYVRAVPPPFAVPRPRPQYEVRPRPRYEVRVGF